MLVAQLGSEAPDVDVDGAGPAEVFVAPDPRQQHLSSEDLAGVGGQELQEFVLRSRFLGIPTIFAKRIVTLEIWLRNHCESK